VIPRLKPFLDTRELAAAWAPAPDAVDRFERAFAAQFGHAHAIAFPYGRSALRVLFEALGIRDAEVVLPAYTCVVAPHAVVLSGNHCRFVDVTLDDFNMNLADLESVLNERTAAIVATHLFGYPLDLDRLDAIVEASERRLGRKILVIHDCAHAFGARWRGRFVTMQPDVALFGLGISKLMTSVFGGMLTTDDGEIARKVRAWRQQRFTSSAARRWMRRAYLLAIYPAFDDRLYGVVRWLQDDTPLLDRLTKAYHLDDVIHFPPDAEGLMTDVEAEVGLVQLHKYPGIVARRVETARFYDEHLQGIPGWTLPPLVDGATYSHYVVRVPDRRREQDRFRRRGIQLGELIEYSVPHMKAYAPIAGPGEWPNSKFLSEHTINVPIHASLTDRQRDRVVAVAREAA
jgi:dTDP-4-amino-4,6-dideoxygalactose transaminase